ncbi:MAG TPA: ABC transporter permease [Candidatus Limnocylindria bacterium]|nr:ABC transporter permease [Candidatus Limnocylindria bacterium]
MTAEAGAFRVIQARARRRRHPLVRWYRRNERVVLSILGVVLFVVLWQAGADAGAIDKLFFSSPAAVAVAGWEEVQDPRFWEDVKISGWELFVGSALAIAVAIPLGLVIGWYRRLNYAADPWLNFANALPRAALVPIIVLTAGLGVEMKIVVVFLGGVFTMMVATVEGVRTVERQLVDVARSFRASQRRIFTSLVIPGTLPFIVSGMRIAVGRVLAGIIIAEFYAQTQGLGVMIYKASNNFLQGGMDRAMFGILLFTLFGIVLYEAVGYAERYFQRWRPSLDLEETT